MSNTETKTIYRQLGISEDVWIYGQKIEEGLKERFAEFDSNAEYNQLKVISAMQQCRVNESCFNYASGYGYNVKDAIRWKKYMRRHFIQKRLLCVRRLHAVHMHLHLRYRQT